MQTTETLLAAWRRAEAELEAADPDTLAWREARLRVDRAKTAYLTRIGDIFDVEGHHASEQPPRRAESPDRAS